MTDKDLRDRIKEVAVEHFNANGYYGTTIRNIAKDMNCSLPMIYYYFKNKKELFDEIIKNEFFNVIKKQTSKLKNDNIENIIDLYTKFIFNLNNLSNYDKQVYRLGIKVYLSFDGDEELINLMDEWERSISTRHREIIKSYYKEYK
ncbi:MAG: TetR/AcrR family transcriptional regulator [Eubacteriales bacterium]|jgi:AcrR family transcriptional regulator|nr:TetR/AcrR family transcriptional regulator [Clostridiales bacterium]